MPVLNKPVRRNDTRSRLILRALLHPAARPRGRAARWIAVAALVVWPLLLSLDAGAAQPVEHAANPSTVKRHMFSADDFPAVVARFQRMGVEFDVPPTRPVQGAAGRSVGTGPSGFPTPYVIEHVRDRFHVHAERRRPQHPVAPMPYVSQEVVFDSTEPGVSPVGTLTLPASGGPYPAVVLVAGAGPHGRDGGMSLHKTLAVLADHFTRQGFAVLRYDKRGVGLTGGALHPGSTTDQYAADALAAVRYLRLHPRIHPDRVGIVGHSEGGLIAAMAAAEAPDAVAFIAMLAGPGLPGIEVKSLQDAAARRVDGMPEPLVQLNRVQERELYDIAASGLGHPAALAAMAQATDRLAPNVRDRLGIPDDGIPVEAYEALLTPWFRRYLSLDPRLYLEDVRCPMLALVGEKDLQVLPDENLSSIARVFEQSGNRRVAVQRLPGINHNLQTARTGAASEYFLIEETVSPLVLQAVSAWMHQAFSDVHDGSARAGSAPSRADGDR